MAPAHPLREAVVGPTAHPRLNERPVKAEIDLGHPRSCSEPPLVLLIVSTQSSDVVERSRFEADEIVALDQIHARIFCILWRHHRLVEAGRQHVDEIDVAGKLVVLLLRHGAGYEDADPPIRILFLNVPPLSQ